MTPAMKRFFGTWLVVLLVWAALLLGGFAVSVFIGDRVHAGMVQYLVNVATVLGSIKLATLTQNRLLARVDPDGRLRAQLGKLGTDAEDEEVPERCPEGRDQP